MKEGIPQDLKKEKVRSHQYVNRREVLDCGNDSGGIKFLSYSLTFWERVIEARLRKTVKNKEK